MSNQVKLERTALSVYIYTCLNSSDTLYSITLYCKTDLQHVLVLIENCNKIQASYMYISFNAKR